MPLVGLTLTLSALGGTVAVSPSPESRPSRIPTTQTAEPRAPDEKLALAVAFALAAIGSSVAVFGATGTPAVAAFENNSC